MLVSITAIGVVPFGVLGVAGWVGILWPYHPRELAFRWAHRRDWWHMIVRWSGLVLIPYAVVPVLGIIIITPSLLLWSMLSGGGLSSRLPTAHFAGGVALAAVVSLVVFRVGSTVGLAMIRRREHRLRSYLADPDRG